jgi:hypothetical protein
MRFEQWVQHPTKGWVQEKGAPVKAIIKVLITRAQNGDVRAFDALAKYGYGTKVEVTGADGAPLMPVGLDGAVLKRRLDGTTTRRAKTDSEE